MATDPPMSADKRSSRQLKAIVLALLVGQNAGLVLATSYSRLRRVKVMYLGATVVLLGEVLKLFISLALSAHEAGSLGAVGRELYAERAQSWKYAVPALVYTLQNNLAFVALSNLSAATYQITAQLKIPMTAALSWALLGRRISRVQWLAVALLCAGVILVQLRPDEIRSKRFGQRAQMRPVVGLAAVLTQACASAFAGVWFERVIKQPRADGRGVPSLWTSSLQLCAFSIPLALAALVTHEAKALRDGGPLQGFDRITLLVLLLHVAGGVLVALTLKHADNVVKTFAVSIAIALSCAGSYLLFAAALSPQFFVGALVVLGATALYSAPDALLDAVVARLPCGANGAALRSPALEGQPLCDNGEAAAPADDDAEAGGAPNGAPPANAKLRSTPMRGTRSS